MTSPHKPQSIGTCLTPVRTSKRQGYCQFSSPRCPNTSPVYGGRDGALVSSAPKRSLYRSGNGKPTEYQTVTGICTCGLGCHPYLQHSDHLWGMVVGYTLSTIPPKWGSLSWMATQIQSVLLVLVLAAVAALVHFVTSRKLGCKGT